MVKHIPENSIVIFLKFNTYDDLIKFMSNPEYQKIHGKLSAYALESGAKSIEQFTNP
jgi:uncharacterized protein (DUF1330 family)